MGILLKIVKYLTVQTTPSEVENKNHGPEVTPKKQDDDQPYTHTHKLLNTLETEIKVGGEGTSPMVTYRQQPMDTVNVQRNCLTS